MNDGTHLRITDMCGNNQSDMRIHVGINHMRGDDSVFKAHSECIKHLQNETLCLVIWDKTKPLRI